MKPAPATAPTAEPSVRAPRVSHGAFAGAVSAFAAGVAETLADPGLFPVASGRVNDLRKAASAMVDSAELEAERERDLMEVLEALAARIAKLEAVSK